MTVPKINPFAFGANPPPIQPTTATPAVVKQPTKEIAVKPAELATASNTVGVNTNIPVGAKMNIAPQLGYPAGTGTTRAFA